MDRAKDENSALWDTTNGAADPPTTSSNGSIISPRSVLFLTDEKLYRKRAFDRMNQRESRARKKDRVQDLEQKNLDLEARIAELERHLAAQGQGPTGSHAMYGAFPVNDSRIWQVLPLSVPPMCRLDHVIHHLVSSGREPNFLQAAIEEIAHSSFPRVVSLLNPSLAETAPVAATIGDHGPWMQITSSAARTAVMYNICQYIRWLLSPTETSYLALPAHLRPVILQLTTPHPMWIDIMPWPHLREQLIYDMNWETDFERFRTIHNQCVSVNWPYPLADILVSNSNNEISLNPLFEEHIRNLGNWSVGPELAQEFPYARSIPQHPVRDEQVT